MSDDEFCLITIFLFSFSFIGIIGAFQSHAFGPFTSIIVGILIGLVFTAAVIAVLVLVRYWWFWTFAGMAVVLGFLHELMGW